MRWTGQGHEAIRATHHKTLELTADASITERATCVVAVAARSVPAAPMAGPVRITVSAAGRSFSLSARANPDWDPSGPAVIRRAPFRLPGTFATEADAAASDLPRDLVDALTDPTVSVEVMVEADVDASSARPAVVLFAADPARAHDPRLAAELDAADVVVAEDAVARRLVGGRAVTSALASIESRVLVVATDDLPGRTMPPDVARIETVGLGARLAVAAACPSRNRLVFVPDDVEAREAMRAAAVTDRLVLRVPADRLETLLATAERERGSGAATVVQEHGRPVRATPDALPELASRDDVFCCLHPVTTEAGAGVAVDPPVRAAIAALLADGVGTRAVARVVAELTGLSRRDAYDAVVAFPSTTTPRGTAD